MDDLLHQNIMVIHVTINNNKISFFFKSYINTLYILGWSSFIEVQFIFPNLYSMTPYIC